MIFGKDGLILSEVGGQMSDPFQSIVLRLEGESDWRGGDVWGTAE